MKEILQLADLVKFADYQPPPETGRDALGETRAVLDAVEQEFLRVRAAEAAEREAQAETAASTT